MKLQPAPTISPEFLNELRDGVRACSFDPPSSLRKPWHSYTEAANEWIEQNMAALDEMRHYCPHALMNPCPETTASHGPSQGPIIVQYSGAGFAGIVPVEYDELPCAKMPSYGKAMITGEDVTTVASSTPSPTTRFVTMTVYQQYVTPSPALDDLVAAPNDGIRTGGVAMAVVFGAAIAALAIW